MASGSQKVTTYSSNTLIPKRDNVSLSNFKDDQNLIYTYYGGDNSISDKPTSVDAFGVMSFKTADSWYGQLLMSSNTATGLYWRTAASLNGNWRKILDSSNYTDYTVTKTGSGASGTWGISISGNAATATKATQDGSGNVITSKYVTLDTDQTNITGSKRFTKAVQCYRYTTNNNLPAITMDKPGSHYIGIGADGTSHRIKFGPCSSLDGAAWVAQSSFNSNQWFFQGSIYGTSTLTIESSATISGGITSQHGHVFNVAGNEFNWIPDGYNSTMWFNYESFSRTNNSTISEYICGNGKHGHANLRAAKVYNAVWNDFAEYREGTTTEAGRVVAATADSNKVSLTYERLQPCAHIISDTFGCSVGQSDTAQTPIGVGGRVLVYPYQPIENYHVGDCLCAAPNGTADIMTREEIIQYPDRIIGIVDEIPNYLIWKQTLTTDKEKHGSGKVETDVKVNGRIWIYVR